MDGDDAIDPVVLDALREASYVKTLAHRRAWRGIPVLGTLVWKPVRRPLGMTAFGINAYTAANAGDEVVEEHTEEQLGHEEIYLVIRGHATFTVDGEEIDAPCGDDRLPRRSEAAAARDREGGGDDGARDRRRARRARRSRRGSTSSRRCPRAMPATTTPRGRSSRKHSREGRARDPLPARLRRGARRQRRARARRAADRRRGTARLPRARARPRTISPRSATTRASRR